MIDLEEKKAIEDWLESKGFSFSHNTDGWEQLWYGEHDTPSDSLDVVFDPKEKELRMYGRKGLISFQGDRLKFHLYGKDVTVENLKAKMEGLNE